MEKKTASAITLTLLLTSMLTLAFNIQPAKAEPGTMPPLGQILFGIEGGNKLVTINPSTVVITDVGPIGFDPVSSLAFDPSGSLFSTHNDPRQPGPQLITIDPLTGMGTAVSDVNFDLGSVSGLVFDPSNTLFGVTFSGDLVTIDPLTGAVTLVGPNGIATTAHIDDIAFDPSGTLFGVTLDPGDLTKGIPGEPPQLVMINPVTGLATSVGLLDPQVVVSGIAFDASGILFGVTCDLDPKLVTIDPLTAVVTVVGSLGPAVTCIGDLAYAAKAEPKTWYVDDDGGVDFTKIQEAINAANPGDTVFVRAGIYYENVVVNKTLSLLGEDSEATIINANRDWEQVVQVTASGITITGFTMRHGSAGVGLWDSSNNIMSGNNITCNFYGIVLYYSSFNSILNNDIAKNNNNGIEINYSPNNNLSSNNIANNGQGIRLSYSSSNKMYTNNIINNGVGIELWKSSGNNMSGNNITDNEYGIGVYYSSNIIVYHNNFVNNLQQVYCSASIDIWDDGYPSGGNYWSDYAGVDVKSGPAQDLPGSDGIGDTPYNIDADNIDHYPSMNPYGAPPPPKYALTITTTVGGTTNPTPGTYTYTANASVQVTAFLNTTAYLFDHWELDGVNVGSANPYSVLMDKNHALKAVFALIPPPLSASISPLSASILVGQSLTFTSTTTGGTPPYTHQWYLNGNPVSGATSTSWTFTPTTGGIYYVYLKVTDTKGNTTQSETARITAAIVPVGGYSIPIQVPTKTEPVLPYIALIATLTAILTKLRPKTKRKH